MALATIEDFEVRHGATGDDEARVSALLDDASALILGVVDGSIQPWVVGGEGAEVPAAVVAVCIQVAYRAWRNPDGVAREEIGAMVATYRGDDQPDVLRLTRAERSTLRRAAGLATGSVLGSIGVETSFAGPSTTNDLIDS